MPEEEPQASFKVALSECRPLGKYSADGLTRNTLDVCRPVLSCEEM